MKINFNNTKFISRTNLNKNTENNFKKTELSFKGIDSEKTGNSQPINYTTVQLHPIAEFNLQLLKDGYTMEQINEHSVFTTTKINFNNLMSPNLMKDIASGKITKNNVFKKHMKSNGDIKAMQRAYISLKEKFNTEDVRKHVSQMTSLEEEISSILARKGINSKAEPKYSAKTMILSILHYVNKDNEPLLQELLNDPNFNNVEIKNALLSAEEKKDIKYPLAVLKMAQENGYKKDFSFPLAILISEANENNIGMIEKMLDEQEFLSENADFVSNRLMNFLRNAGTGLSAIYEENQDLTLNEINELLESESNE